MKYIVGAVVVVIAAIAAIIMLASRPDNPSGTKTTPAVKLADYADKTNSQVSLTNQGRIVGDDTYRAIRITVSQSSRSIEVIRGYDGTVEKSQQYENTRAAYDVFLRALQNLNFTKTKASPYTDERGVCPTGNRFIYRLEDGSSTVHRSWSATCGNAGTFAGSGPTVRQVFQNQIPDYNKFIVGVQL